MTDRSFECGLDRLDGTEQERYGALRAAMRLAVEETRDVPDGYAIRLRPDVTIFRQVAEWISLERRCCPFLCLTLQWSEGNAVWLTLTGGPGVKGFLAGQLAANS
jgi:hypothetical protein